MFAERECGSGVTSFATPVLGAFLLASELFYGVTRIISSELGSMRFGGKVLKIQVKDTS
jgi:hypothetical protein